MSSSYDDYLARCVESAYGEDAPDDIEEYECAVCSLPIGDEDYEIEYEKDGKSIIWTVWHKQCPDEEQS